MDVDRLKGARAERLPAVGHPVDVDALKRGRYGNGLRRGAGSCTHAPQAAVNDTAVDSDTGSKKTPAHTCKHLFSGRLTSSHSAKTVLYLSKTSVKPQDKGR